MKNCKHLNKSRKILFASFIGLFVFMLFGCGSAPSSSASTTTTTTAVGMDLDAAIKDASTQMETRIPSGTMIALVSVASPSTAFSTQVLTRLESAIVSSGKLVVVDRANLDKVRAEQGFQLSGEVDDESAKSIGKLLGAGAIVTGSLTDLGDVYSLTLKAINIETATVAVSYLADLAKTTRIETLLATRDGAVAAAAPRQTPSGGTVAPAAQAAVPAAQPVPAPAATAIAIEVTAKTGGKLYFQDKEVATLWDNETHTISIEGPGTYALRMVFADHTETRSVAINTRGITRVNFGGAYTVGQPGPAGGLVFFDKGSYSDGWRFFEAASADIPGTAEWGANGKNVGGTNTGRGAGKRNTQFIVDYLRGTGETGRAAQIVQDFRQGGYDDWFLPSKDELNLMYENLKQKGLGRFQDGTYWSSSQARGEDAWFQSFRDGEQNYSSPVYGYGKSSTRNVRPIRAF